MHVMNKITLLTLLIRH